VIPGQAKNTRTLGVMVPECHVGTPANHREWQPVQPAQPTWTQPKALADLAITEVEAIGEPSPAQGGKCLIPISFKLTNVGGGTVTFAPVSVGKPGNWNAEQYTNLKSGESRSLVMKTWLPLANHAHFKVVADPAQAIPEQSEQNNSMVGEYSCHS
jgi:hypothetical protein